MRFHAIFLGILLALIPTVSLAQDASTEAVKQTKVVRKIKIQHASPYLIWLLLHGKSNFSTPPEPPPGK